MNLQLEFDDFIIMEGDKSRPSTSTSKERPSSKVTQSVNNIIFVASSIDERCTLIIDVEKDIPAEVYAESVANEIGASALQYAGWRSVKLVMYLSLFSSPTPNLNVTRLLPLNRPRKNDGFTSIQTVKTILILTNMKYLLRRNRLMI